MIKYKTPDIAIYETPNILIVDDEKSILSSLTRLLEMNGIPVMTAQSGADALDIISTNFVDLVISDYNMPGMSGIDLMIAIRKGYPDITRIMLTAFSGIKLMQQAINHGEIYRFLMKPWDDDELLDAVRSGMKQKANMRFQRQQMFEQLGRSNTETVMAIAEAISLKDPYTRGHSARVRDYSLEMGKAIDLPSDMLIHLGYGALLHDCGKIGVPETILLGTGRLDDSEQKIIENHTIKGFKLTRSIHHLETASIFIRQHHERWDGKGYPDGLSGNQIHICSRIISIADTFDAITSDRTYRRGMDMESSIEILIRNRGLQFDPDLIDVFVSIVSGKRLLQSTTAKVLLRQPAAP